MPNNICNCCEEEQISEEYQRFGYCTKCGDFQCNMEAAIIRLIVDHEGLNKTFEFIKESNDPTILSTKKQQEIAINHYNNQGET